MTYPGKPPAHYDYSTFQSASPTAPLPAHQIDADLGNAKTAIDAIIEFQKIVQRSDGLLNNGLVKPETLSASALALQGYWEPRGNWTTATAYAVRDIVFKDNATYVVATAHTSGTFITDLLAGKLLPMGAPPDVWYMLPYTEAGFAAALESAALSSGAAGREFRLGPGTGHLDTFAALGTPDTLAYGLYGVHESAQGAGLTFHIRGAGGRLTTLRATKADATRMGLWYGLATNRITVLQRDYASDSGTAVISTKPMEQFRNAVFDIRGRRFIGKSDMLQGAGISASGYISGVLFDSEFQDVAGVVFNGASLNDPGESVSVNDRPQGVHVWGTRTDGFVSNAINLHSSIWSSYLFNTAVNSIGKRIWKTNSILRSGNGGAGMRVALNYGKKGYRLAQRNDQERELLMGNVGEKIGSVGITRSRKDYDAGGNLDLGNIISDPSRLTGHIQPGDADAEDPAVIPSGSSIVAPSQAGYYQGGDSDVVIANQAESDFRRYGHGLIITTAGSTTATIIDDYFAGGHYTAAMRRFGGDLVYRGDETTRQDRPRLNFRIAVTNGLGAREIYSEPNLCGTKIASIAYGADPPDNNGASCSAGTVAGTVFTPGGTLSGGSFKVGQQISGVGVTLFTLLEDNGDGTWDIDVSQTVGPVAMTAVQITSNMSCKQILTADGGALHTVGDATLLGTKYTITGINTGTGVITVSGSAPPDGTKVYLLNIVGTTQLNGGYYTTTGASGSTCSLLRSDGTALDMSGFSAYTSGGTVYPIVGQPWRVRSLKEVEYPAGSGTYIASDDEHYFTPMPSAALLTCGTGAATFTITDGEMLSRVKRHLDNNSEVSVYHVSGGRRYLCGVVTSVTDDANATFTTNARRAVTNGTVEIAIENKSPHNWLVAHFDPYESRPQQLADIFFDFRTNRSRGASISPIHVAHPEVLHPDSLAQCETDIIETPESLTTGDTVMGVRRLPLRQRSRLFRVYWQPLGAVTDDATDYLYLEVERGRAGGYTSLGTYKLTHTPRTAFTVYEFNGPATTGAKSDTLAAANILEVGDVLRFTLKKAAADATIPHSLFWAALPPW